jgi:hypothetical protein
MAVREPRIKPAEHFAQPRIGLADAPAGIGVGHADRHMVQDIAQALLAVAQGRGCALALGDLGLQFGTSLLQLGGALQYRSLDAPGAAGDEQQQRAEQRRAQ